MGLKKGVLRLQLWRAFHTKLLPYVVLISMVVVTACFVQTCLMFWGHDAGEMPSAATAWMGNGFRANAMLFVFYVGYFLFPLTASLFGDSLNRDQSSGMSAVIASRCSLHSYVLSGAFAAFLVAFVCALAVLLASQAVALIAFPLDAAPDAFVTLGFATTRQDEFSWLEVVPMAPLLFSNRYEYNLLYCLYDALWAGTLAALSYAVSANVRTGRVMVIGIPTVLYIALSAALPARFNASAMLLPPMSAMAGGVWDALVVLALGAASVLVLLARALLGREDLAV